MNHEYTPAEQLSALMDGELPEDEARFLRKRLEHDEPLRAKWARLQLASSCLRGQALVIADPRFSATVRAGIDAPVAVPGRRLLRWGIAASVAVLAMLLAPRLWSPDTQVSPVANVASPTLSPSPASADLVALGRDRPAQDDAVLADGSPIAPASSAPLIAAMPGASSAASPLPLSAQSPADFPLVDNGDKRGWPRSQLPVSADPSLEAYLVRHNQMLAGDGLGGFVPYVDVVATGAADPASSATEAGDGAR